MYRIALVDLQNDADDAFAIIDAGETVMVTRDGRADVQMVPVFDRDDDTERTHDGG